MPPVFRKTTAVAAALFAVALVAGCGGSDNGTGSRSQPALPASAFPAANGRSLEQVILAASKGQQGPVVAPAAAMFYVGTNRFPFGVFTAARDQITDAQVAIYAAPGGSPKGAAIGPFPARIEDLTTKPAFRAKTTADDPTAAQVAYVSDIPLDKPGPWAFGALIKSGNTYQYSLLPTPHPVGQYPAPRVGQKAPVVHTLTVGQVSDVSEIDTRVPPDDMHNDDLANVLGKKPVVLLFATPAL